MFPVRFVFFVSRRYLSAGRKQGFISLLSWLSIAGVALGTMTLIIVISVMAGFERDFTRRILGVRPHILLDMEGGRNSAETGRIRYLQKMALADPAVTDAVRVVEAQAMIRSLYGTSGARIIGIPSAHIRSGRQSGGPPSGGAAWLSEFATGLDRLAAPESGAESSRLPGIVLGRDLAAAAGVFTGDVVHLISPRGMISPAGHMPSVRRFRVAGTLHTGLYEYDSVTALVDLSAAGRLTGARTRIYLRCTSAEKAEEAAARLCSVFAGAGEHGLTATEWQAHHQSLFFALKLEKICMSLLLGLIVLVAVFNISGSLFMLVVEKRMDIAMLKSLGATDGMIRWIFTMRGGLLGVIGMAVGAVAGTGACMALDRWPLVRLPARLFLMEEIPVRLMPATVITVIGAVLFLSLIVSFPPSGKAARINPVDILRHGG